MNKSELVDQIAQSADLSRAAATRALDATLQAITGSLAQAEPVSLVGFGTFTVRNRAARAGHNPKTGEAIDIAASRTAAFKPGKSLKELLN